MTAKEKQSIVIKTYLKPILKLYGYSTKGKTWWRDQGVFFIIINLQNFSFNYKNDVTFCFNIGVAVKAGMKHPDSLYPNYNDLHINIRESAYLSKSRINKFRNKTGYIIDLNSDIEDFIKEFKIDFEFEILPQLDRLKTINDCLNFYEQFPFWSDYLKRVIRENSL